MGRGAFTQVVPKSEHSSRLSKFKSCMEANQIDVSFLTEPDNVFYFSGYARASFSKRRFPECLVIPTYGESVLIVPQVEKEGASKRSNVSNIKIWPDEDPGYYLANTLRSCANRPPRIGIESGDAFHTRLQWEDLRRIRDTLSIADFSCN